MLKAKEVLKYRVAELSITSSLIVRAAIDLGLSYKLLPGKVILISKGNFRQYFKGSMFPCNNDVSIYLADNKYLTRNILTEEKIVVPRTAVLTRIEDWEKPVKKNLIFPLVVKPVNASHGNGATFNIGTLPELKTAVLKAFKYISDQLSEPRISQVLVEEYFIGGHDLRFLVVGNKVVSVLERIPAYVVGDGKSSLQQLIDIYNTEWGGGVSKYDLPLCPIVLDSETKRHLKSQYLTLAYVPRKGHKVSLRWNANISTGGRGFDVTDKVHSQIKKIALQCHQALGLGVSGVDILCRDYQKADTSINNLCVLEVNGAPGLDVHQFPAEGPGTPIAEIILKYIFKIN